MAEPDLIAAPPLRVVAPKPKMTIYFTLLIIALVALITGCVFLYLVIGDYGAFGSVR
jgi:hypothetical protein